MLLDMRQVQLQLVTATVKLFLKKPTERPQQMIQLVLTYATQETDNPDLRDRAYVYWSIPCSCLYTVGLFVIHLTSFVPHLHCLALTLVLHTLTACCNHEDCSFELAFCSQFCFWSPSGQHSSQSIGKQEYDNLYAGGCCQQTLKRPRR